MCFNRGSSTTGSINSNLNFRVHRLENQCIGHNTDVRAYANHFNLIKVAKIPAKIAESWLCDALMCISIQVIQILDNHPSMRSGNTMLHRELLALLRHHVIRIVRIKRENHMRTFILRLLNLRFYAVIDRLRISTAKRTKHKIVLIIDNNKNLVHLNISLLFSFQIQTAAFFLPLALTTSIAIRYHIFLYFHHLQANTLRSRCHPIHCFQDTRSLQSIMEMDLPPRCVS